MAVSYHSFSVKKTLKELGTSKKGLTEAEAKLRMEKYGPNELEHGKKLSPLIIFLLQFKSIMVYMLLFAVVVSYLLGEYIDSAVIVAILIINAVLGFFQEYKAEKAMEALMSLAAPHAVVLRDDKERDIYSRELVKGDIVILNVGDRVPANIRLIESIGLKVDQSHLTGESVSVEKETGAQPGDAGIADRKNIVYMASIITYGKGIGVVTATGMETEIGQIAKNVQEQERETTPLQREISILGRWLAFIVVSLVVILFFIGIIFQHDVVEMFMTSVSLAVSAVPEGLPAVITVTLAIGMQRMAKKNAVVRKLSAVQTLGGVTVICSDKTGTLTKNEMTVTKIFDGTKEYEVTGSGYEDKGDFLLNNKKINPENLKLLLKVSALCNNAYLSKEDKCCSVVGDPTEGSLLVLASKAGINYLDLKDKYKYLSEISFDSKRKRMSVIVRKDGEKFLNTKGAPDVVLELCSKIIISGKVVELTPAKKVEILKKNEEFAANALRVLAMAYKPLPEKTSKYDEKLENDLIFLGLTGMIDPPRPEVRSAINLCRQAGIRVIMLTGDHITTAKAIGKSIGLFNEDKDIALTSKEVDKMSDADFSKAVNNVVIFARISPENKFKIVKELKNKGEIVAVTGDGVNDAPALKSAHIGIAMGITGTDVSKEASEMVLTDDNFTTIVSAVREGRGIFDNIKKFVKFLLASNADTILEVTAAVMLRWPIPFLPVHILWMNLVTDGLPALALSMDPPADNVMQRKPRNPKYSLVKEVAVFILFAGLIDAVASLILYFLSLSAEGFFITSATDALSKARTMAISSAIFYELFFVFNCRDDDKGVWSRSFKENFLSNKFLTLGVAGSLIMQLLFIYNPFFNTIFRTTPLALWELGLVFLFATPGLFLLPRWFHIDLNKKPEIKSS